MDTSVLWSNVLKEIEVSVSKANFTTWFKDTHISSFDKGIIFLSVPNTFVQEWLHKKFHSLILKLLRDASHSINSLEYVIKEDMKPKKTFIPFSQAQGGSFDPYNKELPLSDLYVSREDNLNPRYTFESFIVGPFNELAYAASQAIIKNLGVIYNPLFIYGNPGVGKTHLMQAVGNAVKAVHANKKILYVTSEKFSNDYVNAVQNNKVPNFKDKYRKYDLIIMDDIQFLSGRDRTQEELFHLFNIMKDTNRHLIFSCDKHPNFVSGLEERLKSRFAAGMVIDIPQPDGESRTAIIKAKCTSMNLFLDQEIVDYLSSSVQGNIRDLEGVVNIIICQSEIRNRSLSLSEVKDLIKNSIKSKKIVSSKEVVKIISDFYKIDEELIYKKTRTKDVIKPRQIIMYLLRTDYNISFPSIGEKLGNRDHTTVIHSCDKIKNELLANQLLQREVQEIRSVLGAT